jgi:excinuclease ABC subunit C
MNNIDKLKKKISSLPDAPGVYLMKDASGKILYIGKAKSLRKRLRSYSGRGLSGKTLSLMSYVSDIDYRPSSCESMALLLEAGLIHKYKPRYNVSLRDDKSFPLVKITNEDFPRVHITRKKEADGARYFGPYTNAALLRDALKTIRRYFPYRSCERLPKKTCIYYRIKLSPAPCAGKISKSDYAKTIKRICLILEGKSDNLLKELTRMMHNKAKEQEFEEAAILRDKLIALSAFRPAYTLEAGVAQLKEVLGFRALPRRIEAFDVSNISGRQASASMVSFYNGLADKANYRRFRIKTVKESNDCQMLAEAVLRRYRRVKEENLPLPDLILVDGGKGQLRAGKKELELLGFNIPVISLAKKEELVRTLVSSTPLRLKTNSAALLLLRRIRDESHRFALSYHRILRKRHAFGEPRALSKARDE